MLSKDKPHSAEVLSDLRDGWWNDDYLTLLARRFAWDSVRDVIDVGCGHGHWGQRLAPFMAPDAQLLGIDREAQWIEIARAKAESRGLGDRFTYAQATAEALPADDARFDLATCQTLLMHVADPVVVIAEMVRVVKPGGMVIAAEPNNIAPFTVFDSVNEGLSVEDRLASIGFHLRCREGLMKTGRGDDSVGDRLPRLFADAGLRDIKVCQNDASSPAIPPYSESQRGLLEEQARLIRDRAWRWNRDDAWPCFEAGGGSRAEFEKVFPLILALGDAFAAQVSNGTYWGAGGHMHYVIAGTKPSD